MKPENESRRAFLRNGVLKNALIISEIASELIEDKQPAEKVKMLAPDGSLVEVDAQVVNKCKNIKNASPEDIHHWIDPTKKI